MGIERRLRVTRRFTPPASRGPSRTYMPDRLRLVLLRHATRAPWRRIRVDTVITQRLRETLAPSLQVRLAQIEPATITATREHHEMHVRM